MNINLEIEGKRIELCDKLEMRLLGPNIPKEDCIPKQIEQGKFYIFNLDGWKIFPFQKPIQLFIKGNKNPIANIEITEQTVYFLAGAIKTKGEYWVRGIYKY